MNVGIIGNGFVGNSIYHTFTPALEVRVYDVNPVRATHSLGETIDKSDIIFVCIPTPMYSDGRQDLSYINEVFKMINVTMDDLQLTELDRHGKVFVIKSTVIPKTTDTLMRDYDLNISFSPEFLTERTAVSDSICSNHAIVGGNSFSVSMIERLYKSRFGRAYNIYVTSNTTAEFIKYMRNTFFATKVTYMNEMFRIAANSGVDWEDAMTGFAMDGRIGHSHLAVPGHDGKYGYGGTCFPKDISAIITHSEGTGFEPPLLKAVRAANLKYRGVEDWKSSVGRAVSEADDDDICHPDAIDGTDGTCMECGSKDNI